MVKPIVQLKSTITPRELHRLLAEDSAAELLDVRTPGEFAAAHVPDAKLVPLDDLDPAAFLKQCGADHQPVYVLCQSGGRARKAVEKFRRAGFENCVLVEGGTQAWMDAGLPVVCGQSKALPLMRQVQIAAGFVSAIGAALALVFSSWFAVIPLLVGCGLLFAGLTGFCGLALLLAKMPWNRAAECNPSSCCEIDN
jgi:rhodanese-related sulfurtransferase